MISIVTNHAPANKGKKLPPEPLSPEEVKALIRPCSKRAASGVRNRAMIAVLYRAGLRIGEALALFPKDLDAQAGTLRILHGKGNRDRVVGLDAGAWAIVELWLHKRAALGINGRSPVFCTLAGRPMKSAYVRTLFPRLAPRRGLKGGFIPMPCDTRSPSSLPVKGRRCTSFNASWAIHPWQPPIGTFAT